MVNEKSEVDVEWTTLSAVFFVDYVSVNNELKEIHAGCFGQDLWGDLYSLSFYCYEPEVQEFEALQKLLQPGTVVRAKDSAITLLGSSLMMPEVLPYEGDAASFVRKVNKWKAQKKELLLVMDIFDVVSC
jgi:hypothetical protein